LELHVNFKLLWGFKLNLLSHQKRNFQDHYQGQTAEGFWPCAEVLNRNLQEVLKNYNFLEEFNNQYKGKLQLPILFKTKEN
jgi:hypothetical protein